MGKKNHQNTIVVCILFIITLCQIPSNGFVEGGSHSITKHEKNKTIMSVDGDTYDCVDIYKQPAFSHPLLKNHIIQMKPSSPVGKFEVRNTDDGLFQSWHKNEQCPEGTIPIIRTKFPPKRRGDYKSSKFTANMTNRNSTLADSDVHEYATADIYGSFVGAKARLNVWKPRAANPGEFSLAQMWLLAGQGNDLNSLEAGWQVRHGDGNTRFFIYWTRDNYGKTGCYNLECAGFVQTNKHIGLGGKIRPLSIYNEEQFSITLIIRKDEQTGNWWLNVQGQDAGYWPGSILTALAESATEIDWGGEIVNERPYGRHTSTEMGSGHFSFEGYRKASYFSNLEINDNGGTFKDPGVLKPFVTNYKCYDLQVVQDRGTEYGVHFYYGGPGKSFDCP